MSGPAEHESKSTHQPGERCASCATGSQVIFRVRRPVYLINSTIIVEDGEGNPVGEVHQRWHLWKRKYDLYLERNQFASIEGNFLAWEFVLRDQGGGEVSCSIRGLLMSRDAIILSIGYSG